MQSDFDLIVIGAGSGGVRASRMAAQTGQKVAVIERQYLGGTCVNVGCIPKKLFHYAGQVSQHVADAKGFGWDIQINSHNWQTLTANVASEIARLNGIYRNLLTNSGVELFEGEGRLLGGQQVEVKDSAGNTQVLRAKHILLAVGGTPFVPNIPGCEFAITSDQFFTLPQAPKKCVVVGGGYIALELACVLHGLGIDVTLLHRGNTVLKNFDLDVQAFLLKQLAEQGLHLALEKNVQAITKSADGALKLTLDDGSAIDSDCVVYATGRNPRLTGLGLENTQVVVNKAGYIEVDSSFATAEAGVYALGDIVGNKELTPVALGEAMFLVDHLYGAKTRDPIDYEMVATAVFSNPEVGTIGLTEQAARERFGDAMVQIFKSDFRPLKHTVSGSGERVLMKLVVERATDRVVGLHMVGPEAGEIIQGFAVAMLMGATKAQFDATIGVHPSAAEEFVTMRTPAN